MCSACIKIDVLPYFDRSTHKCSQHNYVVRYLASSWNKFGIGCASLMHEALWATMKKYNINASIIGAIENL